MLAGAGLMLNPFKTSGNLKAYTHFGLNPFILQNPDAVFIMQTNVDSKTNSSLMKAAGLAFGNSIFCLTDNSTDSIPLTHKVVIKPNLTCRDRGTNKYTIEGSMGIVTDAYFVEGIIESLKELGISAGQFYIREVNCPDDLADGGYLEMAARTGIDLQAIDTHVSELQSEKVVWVDVPDGVWFNKIPYLWPVNAPDTWLLNISKFKAHGMGMTLCAKNLQGTIAMDYQAHCTAYGNEMFGVDPDHIRPGANDDIYYNYLRHKADGVPRWDRPGSSGGIWMETWASRCLDNNSVNFAGLHIIEGIYGRDGNFLDGPASGDLATDFMTNYIIFGRNQFHVDNIGHYLAGHEPGNFGLFHMAKERGMSKTINPGEIPLFEWDALTGPPAIARLSDFQRFPLKTYYLQKDYGGNNEPKWHLVNEPYLYEANSIEDSAVITNEFYLKDIFPNPIKDTGILRFYVPRSGHVSAEIINVHGQVREILFNRQFYRGNHTVSLNFTNFSAGFYNVCIKYEDSVKNQKVMVAR
jgi:hypothetical protein